MDSFTQRMYDQAEQRSKNLGITNTNKFPLTNRNQETSPNSKRQSPTNITPSPTKKLVNVARNESNSSSQRLLSSDSKENVDVSLEINITTGPNVQVQVEVEERNIDGDDNVNVKAAEDCPLLERTPIMRDTSRNRLQRLGALYSETENLSSPIHRNEARFDEETQSDGVRSKPTTRLGKLAALASQINNWEDDSFRPEVKQAIPKSPTKTSPQKIGSTAMPKTNVNTEFQSKSILSPTKKPTEKSPSKQLKWDQRVMDALEQQGFQRRESTTSKLIYEYNDKDQTKENDNVDHQSNTASKVSDHIPKVVDATVRENQRDVCLNKKPTATGVTKGLVSDRAAIFETAQKHEARSQKDPAEMSLKERLALFERNKGAALIPKAALGMSVSAKQIMSDAPLPKQVTPEKPKINAFNKSVFAETTASGNSIRNKVAALLSNATTISESQITNDIRKQREKEMNVILGRFNRPITGESESKLLENTPPPPPPPPMPSNLLNRSLDGKSNVKRKSNEKLPELKNDRLSDDEIKRVKVNPTRHGRLYPVLSDIESTVNESDRDDYTTATLSEDQDDYHNRAKEDYEEEDSYMDSAEEDDICNMSLGREIMQAVKRNDPLRPSTRNYNYSGNNHDSSTASDYSGCDQIDDIDDYINEALDENDDSFEENITPVRKGSISSNSFQYARSPSKEIRHQTINESPNEDGAHSLSYVNPVKSELTVNPSSDNSVVTLTHTVSFYRKQQSQSLNNTPVRKLTYADKRSKAKETDEDDDDENSSEKKRNSTLFDEKLKHLLNEIHKQEQIIKQTSQALNYCAQTFEFSGSTESVESERHLLLATKTRKALLDEMTRLKVDRSIRPPNSPQDRGKLIIKDITIPLKEDYVEKLDSGVCNGHHLVCLLTYNEHVLATKTVTTRKGLKSVKFQDELKLKNVYADFTAFLEVYGMTAQREVLPHDIKYHITKKTPKGKKRQPLPSPGGPQTVRTSALTHYGSVAFSIKEVRRETWSLTQESFVSPLLGKIFMRVHCELSVSLDYRGFLTMFEDVSGFGAWHRRWCRLHGSLLSYWKYPDDEKCKPPMGSIDLKNCIAHTIEPVRRDVCARLHTLLVELKRPCQDDDKNSLVLEKHSDYTVVRHLLSADTKVDRDTWCAYFNKALILIRSWNAAAAAAAAKSK